MKRPECGLQEVAAFNKEILISRVEQATSSNFQWFSATFGFPVIFLEAIVTVFYIGTPTVSKFNRNLQENTIYCNALVAK